MQLKPGGAAHESAPDTVLIADYQDDNGTIGTERYTRTDSIFTGSESLTGVYRLTYFPVGRKSNTPLWIVDVANGKVKCKQNQLKVSAKILCLVALQEDPYVNLETELSLGGAEALPAYTKFSIAGTDLPHEGERGTAQERDILQNAIGKKRSWPVQPGDPKWQASGTALGASLGYELQQATPPRVERSHHVEKGFSFVKQADFLDHSRSSANLPGFYVLRFDLKESISGAGVLGDRKIRLWGQNFTIDKVEEPGAAKWRLWQRPASTFQTGTSPGAGSARDSLPGWVLHVDGLTTKDVLELWNEWPAAYQRALKQAIGGRPVTFLPRLSAGAGEGRWLATYSIDTGGRQVECRPLSVHLCDSGLPDGKLTLKGSLSAIRDLDDQEVSQRIFTVEPSLNIQKNYNDLEKTELITGLALKCSAAVGGGASAVVRMGSLDLDFSGTAVDSSGAQAGGWMIVRPIMKGDEVGMIEVHLDVHFAVADVYPGGQDQPTGEEFLPEQANNLGQNNLCNIRAFHADPSDPAIQESIIEQSFRPKPPVVIDLSRRSLSQHPQKPFFLRVFEDVRSGFNQIVRLNIISQTLATQVEQPDPDVCKEGSGEFRDVIVLDHNPFLVAKVHYLPFDRVGRFNSTTIAEWTSGDGDAANWKLQFNQAPFCLVLPPQGIGEEMIKSKSYITDLPIPFRFSPPARLVLDPRTSPTQFAEAPWNLRRILGTPGQPFPGPFVKRLQYELLYGLSCDVQSPMVRLAEIFARIGRIAGRREPEILWPATVEQRQEYRKERLEWALLYQQYLSHIAVLEPWNSISPSLQDKSIKLMEGMTCQIRPYPSSDMQDPFDPHKGSLRGGATWAFESKNIYQTIFSNNDQNSNNKDQGPRPTPSSSASVSDLAISSLGGWGHQMAAFQNDLTKIYADVAMGRAYRYKLERLGRIAVFWNLAKHVIVYERTVALPRQFKDDEPEFPGVPLLRKVREYIEILEDVRSYPDDPSLTNASLREAARQARGPIASCSFPKGAQISVSGTWGSDVRDIGWKVPLWNPSTGQPGVYPKPKISLGVYSTVNEKPQIFPCEIDRPENVFFFTLTKDPEGGQVNHDPHLWNAVQDLDYVNFVPPTASGEFKNGDLRQTSPNEFHVPEGYGPCTFHLVPAPVPANLVHDRGAAQPMSAVLESVTMVRSAVSGGELPQSIKDVRSVQQAATDWFDRMLKAIPAEGDSLTGPVRAQIDQALSQTTFEDSIAKAQTQINTISISEKVIALEKAAQDRLLNSLQKQVNDALGDFQKAAKPILQKFDQNAAKVAIHQFQASLDQALLLIQSRPGQAIALLAKYVDAAQQLASNIDGEVASFKKSLDQFSKVRAADEVEVFLARIRSKYIDPLNLAGLRRPDESVPDPTAFVMEYLSPITMGFEKTAEQIRETAATAASAEGLINVFKASGFYLACTDSYNPGVPKVVANLVAAIFKNPPPTPPKGPELVTADFIKTAFRQAEERWKGIIGSWDKQAQELSAAAVSLEKFKEVVDTKLNAVAADLQQQANTLCKDLVTQAESVKAIFQGEFSKAIPNVDKAKEEIKSALDGLVGQNLAQARQELEKLRDRYSKQASDLVDKSLRSLIKDATGKEAVLQAASKTLSLIRAFGQPPRVPQLDFGRDKIGYYFPEAQKTINITPVVARMNQFAGIAAQGGQILNNLKPLGISFPSTKLFDQLLASNLEQFDLAKVFPNFAGLKLDKLFSGLKLPQIAPDKLKITHGFDLQTRRPFVRGDVDINTTTTATVFSIGPLRLQMPGARFEASTFVDAGIDGVIRRKVSGKITGQWRLAVANQPIVTLKNTTLSFDDSGQIRFSISPKDIELPGAMAFISDLAQTYKGKDSGLSIGLLPDGFQSIFKLPIPNTQAGTSGISNLTLGALFSVRMVDSHFQLSMGFSLARRDAPFSLTIFILGGGGYLEAMATYFPDTGKIGCEVNVAITASASLAISLGPISGGVYVYFGITGQYNSATGSLIVGALVLIRGEVSVLGIVSAMVSLLLEATYNNGELEARGRLSISIKICWCFTLEVNEEVNYKLGKSKGASNTLIDAPRSEVLLAALPGSETAIGEALAAAQQKEEKDDFYTIQAKKYVSSLA